MLHCGAGKYNISQIKVQGNWIKINSDAALNSSTTLAAVARDHRGDVVKGWSKCQSLFTYPSWSFRHSLGSGSCNRRAVEPRLIWRRCQGLFWPYIIPGPAPDWTINTIINDIRNLARSFSYLKSCFLLLP